jgi:hypothetical protein
LALAKSSRLLEHSAVNLNFPPSDDPLVAALQRLIFRIGSYSAVADKADLSDQSLYQVAMVKPHSVTGRPKSVGPNMRKKLDAAFPGWLDLPGPGLSNVLQAAEPQASYQALVTATSDNSAQAGWPHERFPLHWWQSLTAAERAVIEEAMLDAFDRITIRRKRIEAARNKSGKAAA